MNGWSLALDRVGIQFESRDLLKRCWLQLRYNTDIQPVIQISIQTKWHICCFSFPCEQQLQTLCIQAVMLGLDTTRHCCLPFVRKHLPPPSCPSSTLLSVSPHVLRVFLPESSVLQRKPPGIQCPRLNDSSPPERLIT